MTTPQFPGSEVFQQWMKSTTDPLQLEQRMKELKIIRFWLEHNTMLVDSTMAALDLQMKTIDMIKDNPMMKGFDPAQVFNPMKFWADTFERGTQLVNETVATIQKSAGISGDAATK